MKTCSKCLLPKNEETEFSKKHSKTQPWCKDCQNEMSKAHYENNTAYYINRNEQRRAELRAFIDGLKKVPCKDCGNTYDPCAMDFDHLSDKECDVSSMARRMMSKERILAEVAKCEVVCAVCHRIRTKQRGF